MATSPLLKRLNEETVLDTIRSGAPISRAEIARRAGISKPTVSLALRTLLEAGLVREAADGPPGPTYGALYFEPVAEAALVLGIDRRRPLPARRRQRSLRRDPGAPRRSSSPGPTQMARSLRSPTCATPSPARQAWRPD